ncbi:MAG: Ig-like domain-containing protein [Xanthobacteraceae bacterium]
MKRSFALLAALAASVVGAIGLVVPSGRPAAQQANETLRLGLFDGPESVDILPDRLKRLATAARNARPSRGECPRGSITAYAPKGDPLFQPALAAARRDAVRDALARMGVDISQFYFDHKVGDETTITRDTELTYGAPRDETQPTVQIAAPPTGTLVSAGQPIAVTVTASDSATRWESGLRIVELFADSDGGRRVDSRLHPPHLPTCEGQQQPYTFTAAYEVPSPPPLIVRLRAVAKDHKNHQATDTADYPTAGDWYGTVTWTHTVANPRASVTTTASADVSLVYDGRGGLTGRMVGSHSADISMGPCSGITSRRGRIQANLVGSHTPGRDAMAIRAEDKQTTPMRMEISCPGAPPVVSKHPDFYEFYEQALRGLQATNNGGFVSSDRQQRPCEAGSTCTTSLAVRLHRVRQ